MKKLFILFLLAAYCKPANSQILIAVLFGDKLNSGKLEFGLAVSPNVTNLTNSESEYRVSLNLGLFFNIWPANKFSIHAEMIPKGSFGGKNIKPYSLGNDSLNHFFEGGSVERIIRTMNLAILARYSFSKHFFVDAGIQPDLLLKKAKDIFTATFNDNELQYTQLLEDRFTRLDFQLAGGLFYRFKPKTGSMGMGIRYVHGLIDIDKLAAGVQVNTAWQINVTIPIGSVPKEKKPE
jgi:hypothetical protein